MALLNPLLFIILPVIVKCRSLDFAENIELPGISRVQFERNHRDTINDPLTPAQENAKKQSTVTYQAETSLFETPARSKVKLRVTNEIRRLAPRHGLLDDMLIPFDLPKPVLRPNLTSTTRDGKFAAMNSGQIWTGGVVPYVIDPSVSSLKTRILEAMKQYQDNTCIRFVARTNQTNYIKLFSGNGCYSYIGMVRGEQVLSLGPGCGYIGTIVHEIGHALGSYHEQSRSDRDNYITIFWENIKSGVESNFSKLRQQQNRLYKPFDFNSIMIYGNYAFSKGSGLKTLVSKSGVPAVISEAYSKSGLSPSDISSVKQLYGCK